MSDILMVTLGLLAGVVGCLAKPCRPEQWRYVKAARPRPRPMPCLAPEPGFDHEPASAPGFADGLARAIA
jgi:hypothetical protein